jgi:hypothetical protein
VVVARSVQREITMRMIASENFAMRSEGLSGSFGVDRSDA